MEIMDKVMNLPERPSVAATASALGVSSQLLRVSLQRQIPPLCQIGVAVRVGGKKRYTYAIFKELIIKFIKGGHLS